MAANREDYLKELRVIIGLDCTEKELMVVAKDLSWDKGLSLKIRKKLILLVRAIEREGKASNDK